jgi:hypothetical protein
MKNNKFDIISYDIPKFDINVEFTYHSYDEKTEDIQPINDVDIKLQFDNIGMFLSNKITIELKDLKDRLRFDSNISFLQNIQPKILTQIQNFQNENLNNFIFDDIKALEYFNSNLSFDDKSISFISGLNEKYKSRILQAYGLDKNSYPDLTKHNQRNVIYGVDYLNDIMQSKLNSQYAYDFKNAEFLSDINQIDNEMIFIDYLSKNISIDNAKLTTLFESQKSKQNIFSSDILPLLFSFIPFEITPVIEDDANLKNETGVAFVGFLIKKHIKNSAGEMILDSASQFIYVDINSDSIDQIILYDNFLNYANSYSYEIIPVFYLGLYRFFGYRQFNFPLISHHLVWNNSQRTEFVRAVDYFAPEPPNAVTAKFLSQKFQADIMWSHPTNPQGDVVGFQIYRRKSLFEPFQLIKVYLKKKMSDFRHMKNFSDIVPDELIQISTDNTLKGMYHFIDESVDLTQETCIYAICSIDAHGYVSNYSSQIGLRYSKIYNSLIIDQVSMQNAPRSYPNLYVQRKSQLFENDDLIFDFTPNFKNKKYITVYFTPDATSVANPVDNRQFEIFNIDNEYQLSVSRLNDLNTKNIKFKLSLT